MTRTPRTELAVRVMPRASRTALVRDVQGMLRAYVHAPPVEGAANRAVVELLAEVLDCPKSAITVVRGERTRDKVVAIAGIDASELGARLRRAGVDVDKARHRG